MPQQTRLFERAALVAPIRRHVVRMHADDSGGNDCVGKPYMGHFVCRTCGHEAGWKPATGAELRRGLPCPICNPESEK